MPAKFDFNLNIAEARLFRRLSTPERIQDYLDSLPVNFDDGRDTCSSPRMVIGRGTAHCIEAAMLACAVLLSRGEPAFLLDLKANDRDLDHVMCLFRRGRHWGAISKTRYPALRYRDPIYRSVRELAASCFHEYVNAKGEKTLRSFSAPFSMRRYDESWVTEAGDLWQVAEDLDASRHFPLLPKGLRPRPATAYETWAGELVEWVDTPAGPRRRKLKPVRPW